MSSDVGRDTSYRVLIRVLESYSKERVRTERITVRGIPVVPYQNFVFEMVQMRDCREGPSLGVGSP